MNDLTMWPNAKKTAFVLWIVSLPEAIYFATVLYVASAFECSAGTAHWYCIKLIRDMAFPTLLVNVGAFHILLVLAAGVCISLYFAKPEKE